MGLRIAPFPHFRHPRDHYLQIEDTVAHHCTRVELEWFAGRHLTEAPPKAVAVPAVSRARESANGTVRASAIVEVFQDADLLPHYLDHYFGLGFRQVIVGLHGDSSPEVRRLVTEAVRDRPVVVAESYHGDFNCEEEVSSRERLRARYCAPDEWVASTDLDEFAEYPEPLATLLPRLEAEGHDALYGDMVDRVADEGALPDLQPAPCLFRQFPWGGTLTGSILGGNTQKVMLYRGPLRLGLGQHDFAPDAQPRSARQRGVVHHFKWSRRALGRVQERFEILERQGAPWAAECDRFLQHWRTHGRICLADPRLQTRWLGPPGPPKIIGPEELTYDAQLYRRAVETEGYFQINEAALLMRTVQAAPPGSLILEIGSYFGRSTLFGLSALGPGQRWIALDTFQEVPGCAAHRFWLLLDRIGDPRLTLLPMSLAEAYPHLQDRKYHVLFIDGDHSYRGAAQDLALAISLAAPDAALLCHDVSDAFPGVLTAVAALERCGVIQREAMIGCLARFRVIDRPPWLTDATPIGIPVGQK